MIQRNRILLFVAGLFLLSSVACSNLLPERRSAEEPRREVVVSQESAQQAQQIITEAAAGGTLRMSEAQFTSLIVTQLGAGGGDMPITDVTVWFDPGKITMQGELAEGVVPLLSGQLVTTGALAVVNNQVVFQVESASIGSVSLPGAGRDILAEQVNNALARSNLGNRVRAITINQGEIIIEQE